MSYSKKSIYRIISKLYKELKDNPEDIIVKNIHGHQGEYDYGTDSITIDCRKMLIPTLIHEYLHKWNPDKCETWVLHNEAMIVSQLSEKQIKNIILAFACAISVH